MIRDGAAPYVLCLNPDTRVTAGALDRLLDLMDERRQARHLRLSPGAPRRYVRLRSQALVPHARSARSGTSPGSAGARVSGVLAAYRAPEVESGPVDAVNGAFMLFRRSALDEVGLFDEGYWMYMEDLDLCYRFAEAGWVTWYEPSATVVHVKAGSSGPVRSPRLNYAFHYGMFRFYRKHYAAPRRHARERDRLRRDRRRSSCLLGGPERDQASNPGSAGRAAPSGRSGLSRGDIVGKAGGIAEP